MYYSARTLAGYAIETTNGPLGRCLDLLMDEDRRAIRYFVVDTRKWLPGRKVVLSPASLAAVNRADKELRFSLTQERARNAPPLDSDAPVSRKYERRWAHYYGHQHYWLGPELWGASVFPGAAVDVVARPWTEESSDLDHHGLRSTGELCGYEVLTRNGLYGSVSDFLIDSRTWAVELVAGKPGPGTRDGEFVVPSTWVSAIDCVSRTITVDAAREHLVAAPGYDLVRAASDDGAALRDYACRPAPRRLEGSRNSKRSIDRVDEASLQSFPASDAPPY